MSFTFDLTVPAHAYTFGFLQADGHLRQGVGQKGHLTVELNHDDAWLLSQFQALFPVYSSIAARTRDTNFKKDSVSAVWTLYDIEVRTELNRLGLPYGKKSSIVDVPHVPFSAVDYFRGIVDANGSIGLTGQGKPFVSWCVPSPAMKNSILAFLLEVTQERKDVQPNKRDRVYNIISFMERAQTVAGLLYYDGCLALPRKVAKAREIAAWARPADVPRVTWERKRWGAEEDAFVMAHTVAECVAHLGRTPKSVTLRKHRLKTQVSGEGP